MSSTTEFITNNDQVSLNGSLSGALGSGEQLQISLDSEQTWQTVTGVSGTTWSYTDTATLPDGNYIVQTQVINTSTGLGGGISSTLVVVDTQAPTEAVNISSVSSDGETITCMLSQALANGSQPGVSPEYLMISLDGGQTWQQVTDINGTNWSDTSSTPLANRTSVEVNVIDAAVNEGQIFTQTITVDDPITGPTETVSITAISPDTGTSSTDFVTSDDSLTFSGTLSNSLPSRDQVQISLNVGQTWQAATSVNWYQLEC